MKKTGKRMVALFSAMAIAMTGTMCLAEGEKTHTSVAHYGDGSEIPLDLSKRDAALTEWKDYWGDFGIDLGDGKHIYDYLQYGGDINIPVGEKVVIHWSQTYYSYMKETGEGNPDDYITTPMGNEKDVEPYIDFQVVPTLIEYPSDRKNDNRKYYCLPYEITGLKNGTISLAYQSMNMVPRFYRIIVGNGKNEGGSQPAAAATPAKAASTAAEKPAGAVWTAKQL